MESNHYGNCWSDNERDGWILDLSYFPFYSSGTNRSSFHGRGLGHSLFLPCFIMAVRLPQNHYTRKANQWNRRNAVDGRNRNWGPCYRIFNHILRRSYFALPWETFACSCSNILCENGAEESKNRNLAEFMETYVTENITIAGWYRHTYGKIILNRNLH